MQTDEFGELSSFAIETRQKGLLTFYQELWYHDDTQPFKDQNIIQKKSEHKVKKIKSNPSLIFDQPVLTQKKYKNHFQKIIVEQNFLKDQTQPFEKIVLKKSVNSFSISKVKNSKQNINLSQKITNFDEKQDHIFRRIKKEKTFESVHIRNYPFQEKEQQKHCIDKFKNHLINIRIKKGSSFKGLHNSNVCCHYSLLNAKKDQILKPSVSKVQMPLKLSEYEAYYRAKQSSNYVFPIITAQIQLSKQKQSAERVKRMQDSLSKYCEQGKKRQQRNTEIPLRYYANFS